MKFGESLARNIDFEIANFEVLRINTCRKTKIFNLASIKIEGSLARNARFGASMCVVSSFWLRRVYGEAAKPVV